MKYILIASSQLIISEVFLVLALQSEICNLKSQQGGPHAE
jgi:hypothetical protein